LPKLKEVIFTKLNFRIKELIRIIDKTYQLNKNQYKQSIES